VRLVRTTGLAATRGVASTSDATTNRRRYAPHLWGRTRGVFLWHGTRPICSRTPRACETLVVRGRYVTIDPSEATLTGPRPDLLSLLHSEDREDRRVTATGVTHDLLRMQDREQGG
jgi:hypothetical protein